ncbi:MAG: deoxyribonuclease IV [bacterium]|nr:deoxyribonuclease IV [bacterium]
MLIGAHVSIAGGYDKAIQKIVSMGGNCMQIFSSSPRGWSFATPTKEQIETFKKLQSSSALKSIYFHASYLVNLADNGQTGSRSVKSLIHELNLATAMGIRGSIIHLGSYKSGTQPPPLVSDRTEMVLIANIKKILSQTPKNTFFIIENAGNRKIGKDIEEIGIIIKTIKDPRVKVCLDTCHLHAAGYDLTSSEKLNQFLEKFDMLVGNERLEVIHANDSRDAFASLRDRHENLGEGQVGKEVFINLLRHSVTKNVPFIIETPGFDNKGPDKHNVDILKSLI